MLVCCERKSGKKVRADQYEKHLQGRCRSHYQYLASKVTLKDVLAKPATQLATPVKMKCAQHLVRRILDTHSAPNEVIKLSTRGQVN